VHSGRSLADASRLRDALGRGVRLLVVGCGFVGIETASTVRSLGAEVTVVGIDPPVAPAGPLAVTRAQQLLAEAGVSVHVGHTVTSVTENANSFDVVLSDGTALQVDEVVVSIGSIPNVDWLAGSGADTRNGVACDEFLRVVGLDDVYAAGDIVSWPNAAFSGQQMRVEHWSNAAEQGTAAARNLLAATASRKPFGTVPSFWSDHFGTKLQSVGVPRLADRFEVVAGDVESGSFCAEAYAGDVLVGGVSYGMPREIVRIRLALTRAGVALLPVSG
jgi:NADPH-dependent 2,4-dienoyl-CoA reductase/sulfur reductase-like enzyme